MNRQKKKLSLTVVVLLALAMTVTCTACGGTDSTVISPDNDALPLHSSTGLYGETSSYLPDNSLSEEVNSHLPEYENLDWYQEQNRFPDFVLSEENVNGELFYQLSNEAFDVIIRVNRNEDKAYIQHKGKETAIDILGLFPQLSASSEFLLRDVTGDNLPEVIYLFSSGGTGGRITQIAVYEIEKMVQLPIEDFVAKMAEYLEVSVLSIDDTFAKCEVRLGEEIQYGYVQLKHETKEAGWRLHISSNDFVTISVEENRFCVRAGFTIENGFPGMYLGEIIGELKYDELTGAFRLSKGLTLNLHYPTT